MLNNCYICCGKIKASKLQSFTYQPSSSSSSKPLSLTCVPKLCYHVGNGNAIAIQSYRRQWSGPVLCPRQGGGCSVQVRIFLLLFRVLSYLILCFGVSNGPIRRVKPARAFLQAARNHTASSRLLLSYIIFVTVRTDSPFTKWGELL